MNSPFPSGSFSDLRIFRKNLKNILENDEQVIDDRGYPDTKCVHCPNTLVNLDALYSTVRARHEGVNKRIEQFKVINSTFRHNISTHGLSFHAVANLTQLMILNGCPPFQIKQDY